MSLKAIKQQIVRLMEEDPHGWTIEEGRYSWSVTLSHDALDFTVSREAGGWQTVSPEIRFGSSPWLLEKAYRRMVAVRVECAVTKALGQIQ